MENVGHFLHTGLCTKTRVPAPDVTAARWSSSALFGGYIEDVAHERKEVIDLVLLLLLL